MSVSGGKVLVLAARQPDFARLLEDDGFAVQLRSRPLAEDERVEADLAVVFRGRLIGRNQASILAKAGIPVVEVLTMDPPGTSNASWIRVSNRILKSDLAQIVHALHDWTRAAARGEERAAARS